MPGLTYSSPPGFRRGVTRISIMIPKSVLVAEAVLTSRPILMSLIVEHVYRDWPLSWTLALQSLRAPEAMPDSVHAGTLLI